MGDIRDIGRQAVEEIASLWQVDRSRSVRTENGFEWWPGDFRVAVMAHDGFDVHPDSCLLRVRTDFLQDIPINDDGFVRLAAATSRFCAPTYAWAYPPPELWDKYAKGEDRPELWSINTAYLTRENASWLAQFLAQMSIMQPINAQLQAAGLGEVLCGGIPHISQPAGAKHEGVALALELAAAVYAPVGDERNRWAGSDEFSRIAESLEGSDSLGKGDGDGLILETSFGTESALIKLYTDPRHPQLGTGLLGTIQLPVFDEPTSVARECALLNFWEATTWTDIPLFGCWHPHALQGSREGPAFSTFVPNALYRPGLATAVAGWLYQRAHWVRRERWPELQDQPILEILQRRMTPNGGRPWGA